MSQQFRGCAVLVVLQLTALASWGLALQARGRTEHSRGAPPPEPKSPIPRHSTLRYGPRLGPLVLVQRDHKGEPVDPTVTASPPDSMLAFDTSP